jgi:uncharacterized cupredoxin-like copper-binding protein
MRKSILMVAGVVGIALIWAPAAFAVGDMTDQEPIEVRVDLGQDGVDQHRFHPDTLTFETGKLYKLVIHNPSNSKHYFTSLGLAASVFTRKVQVMDDIGADRKAIAEIKGNIREIEVVPGGTSEWWFVPVAAGTITDMHCHIKEKDGETHAQKGMTGTIVIN